MSPGQSPPEVKVAIRIALSLVLLAAFVFVYARTEILSSPFVAHIL
ncbi:hypothetical protein CPTD_00092 [Corynebacterium pseudotuberculosis]|nr:hypothetical protein CPTA_01438 [Corynebacterium pseudotuberculosis]AIG08151.1 hypothetical protein CPTB_00095 [Corynebacterium pseudotuberculosis]AIG11717.1 hypothetical protein CPTC_01429 [Corynebacterium pseudotuberculosis]KEX88354.1 hypothetical protein CPTD_00092 [Corynebacterium pseudotuberculosis]